MHDTDATTMTSRRVSSELVAECRSRQTQKSGEQDEERELLPAEPGAQGPEQFRIATAQPMSSAQNLIARADQEEAAEACGRANEPVGKGRADVQ